MKKRFFLKYHAVSRKQQAHRRREPSVKTLRFLFCAEIWRGCVEWQNSTPERRNIYQLHAVSRTQQGRQREPSVKTLRSPLSRRVLEALRVEWRNSAPRFASTPERGNENINVNKYFTSRRNDNIKYFNFST